MSLSNSLAGTSLHELGYELVLHWHIGDWFIVREDKLAWLKGDNGPYGVGGKHAGKPAVLAAVGVGDKDGRACALKKGSHGFPHEGAMFIVSGLAPCVRGLLAEELLDGGRIRWKAHTGIEACLAGRNPEAVAKGVPGEAFPRSRGIHTLLDPFACVASPAPARLIDDVGAPAMPWQNGLIALAAIRGGLEAFAGLAYAVPEDEGIVPGLFRDVELRVAMVPVKGLPVGPVDNASAKEKASHGGKDYEALFGLLRKRLPALRKHQGKSQHAGRAKVPNVFVSHAVLPGESPRIHAIGKRALLRNSKMV